MERVAANLEKVMGDALRRAPRGESVVLAWPLACGSAVADRTRVLGFSAGVLSVEVSDQDWRRELSRLASQYVAAINKYSRERVERIEFAVANQPRNVAR